MADRLDCQVSMDSRDVLGTQIIFETLLHNDGSDIVESVEVRVDAVRSGVIERQAFIDAVTAFLNSMRNEIGS